MANFPANAIVVGDARAIAPAIVLEPEFDKYNAGAFKVRQQSASCTVISFVSGAVARGDTAPAGTHDGMRDGENNTAWIDFSRMLRYVCTAEAWADAGNALP